MIYPPPTDSNCRLVCGVKGEKILTLALTYGSPEQWRQWLRLPLMGAAVEGDAELVKELLAAGADGCAGHTDPDDSTILHAAAEGGSEKVRLCHRGRGRKGRWRI